MSKVVHLECEDEQTWCRVAAAVEPSTYEISKCDCLKCLLACAEYGSEARHRYDVLRENGVRP